MALLFSSIVSINVQNRSYLESIDKPVMGLSELCKKTALFLLISYWVGISSYCANAQQAPPAFEQINRLSQSSTDAIIYGGASRDGGSTYDNAFTNSDTIYLQVQITPDSEHIGKEGSIFIAVNIPGLGFFQQRSGGQFIPWNGSLNDLQQRLGPKILQDSEIIEVINNIVLGQLGLSDFEFQIYAGYRVNSAPDDLIFTGKPRVFSITDGSTLSAGDYYEQYFSSYVENICSNCHNETGPGRVSRLLFLKLDEVGAHSQNFNTLRQFVVDENGGASLLLAKPRGVAHGGGNPLPSDSEGYQILEALVRLIINESGKNIIIDDNSNNGDFWQDVNYLSNEETLRKAALLFVGRTPTVEEFAQVVDNTDTSLKPALRNLMGDQLFENFLLESANDQLLTLKFSEIAFFVEDFRYENSRSREIIDEARGIDTGTTYVLTNLAISYEPLKLISHVVMNERPYTEVLTADYIMVNPWSNVAYGSGLVFNDNDDWHEWREGSIENYMGFRWDDISFEEERFKIEYPHTGILNSPVFLARYPSTATNRNRARAKKVYKFFLGVDIDNLAPRTTDPDALADTNNPTMNNPHCNICHQVHDPVAGAFQLYGDEGHLLDSEGAVDSLPYTYKYEDNSLYQEGDTWYRNMRSPGFNNVAAPQDEDSLRWLAGQIINDERFARGTVQFWFKGIFGLDPLTAPADVEDFNYQTRLRAYEAETQLIDQWAEDFRSGSSAYNLKDLLVEMIASPRFRAAGMDKTITPARSDELAEIGMGRLLSPEQLNRKFEALTGYRWVQWVVDGYESKTLLDRYQTFYGAIDSDGITVRPEEITTLMSMVIEKMANETACGMVLYDLLRPQGQRYLLPYVEMNDTPDTDAGRAAIRENIRYLHQHLLGEFLSIDDPLIDLTVDLFNSIRQYRMDSGAPVYMYNEQENCVYYFELFPENYEVPVDSEHTIQAWMAVMIYMLSDYRFLYE